MNEKLGNQWAFLTNFSVDTEQIRMEEFGNPQASYYIPSLSKIHFEGIAPATPQILIHMMRWMKQDKPLPIFQEEWLCLYCGSPNPLPDRHCLQCGAPRNWLL